MRGEGSGAGRGNLTLPLDPMCRGVGVGWGQGGVCQLPGWIQS